MKYPTVSALCEGVAGAIREKDGSSALINPQDFVERIKGLEVGGGGSKWRYFKVVRPLPSAGGGDQAIYSQMSQLTRCEEDGKVYINSASTIAIAGISLGSTHTIFFWFSSSVIT